MHEKPLIIQAYIQNQEKNIFVTWNKITITKIIYIYKDVITYLYNNLYFILFQLVVKFLFFI